MASLGFAALAICWMVRSFALTFAAVTLRLQLGLYGALEVDVAFADAYAAIAWLCWVPNLLVAWWATRTDQLGWVRAAERP